MGREKRNMQSSASSGPKERHRRNQRSQWDPKAPMPQGFDAKPNIPKTKSKHHSYFEFVDNEDKKKKLEFKVTTQTTPPPGFEFVPSGNPELTTACKELSREKDAMIFIVSTTNVEDPNHLSHHVHRIGHHIRETIVEEARSGLTHIPTQPVSDPDGNPVPLPDSQDEYTAQANASILDFFPRIPNTDRQTILLQSFNLSSKKQHPKPVGLCSDIPLSRRVQLAVLAHIRHTHTRYDELLRETSWQNARKVVEGLCLDILVKWRGDEETGRDQLDEILREVVVISDSEDEDGDDGHTEESSAEEITMPDTAKTPHLAGYAPLQSVTRTSSQSRHKRNGSLVTGRPGAEPGGVVKSRITGRKEQRGFKRYRAWEEAIQRNRGEHETVPHDFEKQPVIDRRTPYSGAPRDTQEKRTLLGSLGMVPYPNGFVPKHHHRSGSGTGLDVPPRPHSASLALSPRERRATPVARELAPSASVSHIESPLVPRLQDMLVRSIEPASPGAMQPSFVRALPPRIQQSPSRVSLKPRPVPVSSPWESGPRTTAVYTERRPPGERHPIDSLPRRHLGYGEPSRDYHSPQPNDFGRIGPHPPTYPGEASIYGARTSSVIPARTIFMDADKPGPHHHPILMEDRGGFYERVPLNPQPYRPPVNGEIWSSQPSQAQGREPEAHRMILQDKDPRSIPNNRRVRDAEPIPSTGFHALPPEHHSRLVPVDHNEQQWLHNSKLYEVAPRSPAQIYQRRIEPLETRVQRAGDAVVQPPYHYTQYYGGMMPADESRDLQRYRQSPLHRPPSAPPRAPPRHPSQQARTPARDNNIIVLD